MSVLTGVTVSASLFIFSQIATGLLSPSMWRLLSLFLLLSQFRDASSANCTSGWTDQGNGICQSPRYNLAAQYGAYATCAAMNAYMSTIANAFENSNVASIGVTVWLGLTCTSSQTTSCLWDNGVSITNTSYTNFATGYPNMTIGACVYINSAGLWYSTDCAKTVNYYVCRTAPGVYIPKCTSPGYYFRGHCYYPVDAPNYGAAATPCNANCGNIASIHNDGENSYVRDMANTKSTGSGYTFIGMTYTNGYQWDDGTQMNYDKFGLKIPGLGCVLMATVAGGAVLQGQWLSADCSDFTVALLSPNYPLGSGPNHCQYIITEDSSNDVTFIMEELFLDSSSTIKFYNSPIDSTPFLTYNNNSRADNSTTIIAATNFLRILFDTPGNINYRNHWKMSYGVHQSGAGNCGGTFSKSPEVVRGNKLGPAMIDFQISGPHTSLNCTYNLRMGATTGRTCIRLSSIVVQSGDSISIYDGPVDPQNRIGLFVPTTGSFSYRFFYPALCTSTSNYMTIITTRQSGLGYEMFLLTAADSPEVLNPGPIGFSASTTAAVPTTASRNYAGSTTYYGFDYYTTDPNSRVQANFTYLSMPSPSYIFIMDGNTAATVALAYGSLFNSRMVHQTTQQHIAIYEYLYSGYSTGFTSYFTAV